MFTKLGRDEVLMVPYKCCYFSARSFQGRIQDGAKIGHGGPLLQRTSSSDWKAIAQGRIQGGAKIGHGGPLLQRTSSSDRKATATNRMHSSDLEACGKKCCYFWFHSEVKFDAFLTSFWTSSFCLILMQFLWIFMW